MSDGVPAPSRIPAGDQSREPRQFLSLNQEQFDYYADGEESVRAAPIYSAPELYGMAGLIFSRYHERCCAKGSRLTSLMPKCFRISRSGRNSNTITTS